MALTAFAHVLAFPWVSTMSPWDSGHELRSWSAPAALSAHHRLGLNQHSPPRSPGGWKPEVKVPANQRNQQENIARGQAGPAALPESHPGKVPRGSRHRGSPCPGGVMEQGRDRKVSEVSPLSVLVTPRPLPFPCSFIYSTSGHWLPPVLGTARATSVRSGCRNGNATSQGSRGWRSGQDTAGSVPGRACLLSVTSRG